MVYARIRLLFPYFIFEAIGKKSFGEDYSRGSLKNATRNLSLSQIHKHKNAYYLSPQTTAALDPGRDFYVIPLESYSGSADVLPKVKFRNAGVTTPTGASICQLDSKSVLCPDRYLDARTGILLQTCAQMVRSTPFHRVRFTHALRPCLICNFP